jgi:hypothetical protein
MSEKGNVGFFFSLAMFVTSIFQVLVDSAARSEHGILIECDIGAKTVERSGNEYMIFRLFISVYKMYIITANHEQCKTTAIS